MSYNRRQRSYHPDLDIGVGSIRSEAWLQGIQLPTARKSRDANRQDRSLPIQRAVIEAVRARIS